MAADFDHRSDQAHHPGAHDRAHLDTGPQGAPGVTPNAGPRRRGLRSPRPPRVKLLPHTLIAHTGGSPVARLATRRFVTLEETSACEATFFSLSQTDRWLDQRYSP